MTPDSEDSRNSEVALDLDDDDDGSEEISSADPGFGQDQTDSSDPEADESESSASDASASFESLGVGSSTEAEPYGGDLPPVPGTDYEIDYVRARVGKSAREWDRPKNIRVEIFEGTITMLDDISQWINEEVYPDVNVLDADIQQAALLVGLANPEEIVALLDEWGYDKI
jgi:hypothetical protein